ncbi:ABC-three component system middle component 6 [Aliihoeflea sp. 40Bstr573]|uniref:ABC-three component system middle component 6 n=1 Tax=Aliihoeflea sp. 40Bstr573 TaxID=2696467 RepID=UPI00209581C0|nr:ABC-three component system middle component 6 [Aliihoeflea sp. 40Bstr573]
MILPDKFLPAERSLMFIGGEALREIKHGPRTVSEVWEGVRASRRARGLAIGFDWFTLALTFLFAAGMVEIRDGLLHVTGSGRA